MPTFLESRRIIGFKIEGTPYTAETLTSSDFDVPAYNIQYTPDIAMKARKIARGNFQREVAVAGKRKFSCSFDIDAQYGASAATPPTYWKCERACGQLQTTYTTVGVGLACNSDYSNVPATIWILEKEEGTSPDYLLIRAKGCMGNRKIVIDTVGAPAKHSYEFQGALVSIERVANASAPIPTGFNTTIPDAVMGVTISIYGEVQTIDKLTIDLGNTVEVYTDPSPDGGISGAHVVDRNPKVELDPDLLNTDERAFWTRWTGETAGALVVQIGNSQQILSSAIQLEKAYQPGSREGHVVNNLTLMVLNDDLETLQGSKT